MADRERPALRRRRPAALLWAALAAVAAAGCGGTAHPAAAHHQRTAGAAGSGAATTPATTVTARAPALAKPALTVRAPRSVGGAWRTVALVHGQPAAWIAARANATLMRFDQRLTHLTLHAGINDGGASGWAYGDRITRREIHQVVAAFNGGFKLTYRDVGFVSGHHAAVALKPGLGSIVTYADGATDIGAWREGAPAAGRPVFSVLQNQHLLVDHGEATARVSGCVISCWGETIGSATFVARSGLGVSADGRLVWAAGEQLSPAGLARALIAGGAVRAVELDINPFWVAGYLYIHRPSGPEPFPVVPGQHGIAGELLEPASRDFLAVVANG